MGEIVVEKSLEVEAPALAIWEEMMKVSSWPEWKPFMKKAGVSGYDSLTCGAKIKMSVMVGGSASVPLSATVIEFNRPERLVWEGGVKGLFHAVHSFDFKSMGDKTRVTSREEFNGVLTGVVQLMVTKDDLERLHEQWLIAIKKRMERE